MYNRPITTNYLLPYVKLVAASVITHVPGKDWHASTVPECTVTTIATMSYIQQFVVPGKLWLLITLTPKGHRLFFFFSFLFFGKKKCCRAGGVQAPPQQPAAQGCCSADQRLHGQ
jgi:hypothetical protein